MWFVAVLYFNVFIVGTIKEQKYFCHARVFDESFLKLQEQQK